MNLYVGKDSVEIDDNLIQTGFGSRMKEYINFRSEKSERGTSIAEGILQRFVISY